MPANTVPAYPVRRVECWQSHSNHTQSDVEAAIEALARYALRESRAGRVVSLDEFVRRREDHEP